ncbi:MAG: cytochrome P450 [Pseudomonadota bacterium]
MSAAETKVAGRNGIAVRTPSRDSQREDGFRTYEVYQRERVGESTAKIKPRQLMADEYRRDPYPALTILRENYPCYRDWLANRYWLTRYDDVTSVFADDANFETRPKTWYYGLEDFGRDLNQELPVLTVEAKCYDQHTVPISERLLAAVLERGRGDLVRDFTARLPLELLCALVGIPEAQVEQFCSLYWQAQRGVSWQPALQRQGHQALMHLAQLIEPLLKTRSADGEDLLSACLQVDPKVTAQDIVVTLLERDHETLQGALSNLWFLLLTQPQVLNELATDRRLMKLAYLETLRHSTPVLTAQRFAKHEVERFGRLLPEGALVVCSAAAANRDPRIFADPDRFIVDRPDLTQREPRGQYRADGLASGIAFGLGKPSRHPAVPEDRPRSRYALTRDTAVDAAMTILESVSAIELAPEAVPELTALTLGEMHTCWRLPVTTRP